MLRIDEGNALPRTFKGCRLCLAVANDCDGHELRVVHNRAECVHEYVPELATLVNGSRRRHRRMAWDSTRGRELPEQLKHSGFVLGDLRETLGVGALQPGGRDERRTTVAGPRHVDR